MFSLIRKCRDEIECTLALAGGLVVLAGFALKIILAPFKLILL